MIRPILMVVLSYKRLEPIASEQINFRDPPLHSPTEKDPESLATTFNVELQHGF
jgi:hypothetical protein